MEGMTRSGAARRINRQKYDAEQLRELLQRDPVQCEIFTRYQQLLRLRRQQGAFHPDAAQQVIPTGDDAIVVFQRDSRDAELVIAVIANFSTQPRMLSLSPIRGRDLISNQSIDTSVDPLQPCQILWVETTR